MATISVEEWEVLSFFEVQPKLADTDIAWRTTIPSTRLSVVTYPYPALSLRRNRDVRLILKRGGKKLYELNATGVDDVKYETKAGERPWKSCSHQENGSVSR